MSLSQKGIERIRRGLKRSWKDGTHRQLQQQRPVSAEDIRMRALHDRKGSFFAAIHAADGRVFKAYWSTMGRTDQVDLFLDNAKIATVAPYGIWKVLHECSP